MSALDFLLWLQGWSRPWLDTVMGVITYLGSEYFYIAALGLLYWCVDVRGTMRLFVIFLSSTYLGAAIKEITGLPRPFQAHPDLIQGRFTEVAGGLAFPSSHAMDSTVFWGYLMMVLRKRWLYIVGPILVVLISFSRLYLGVHWPRDVIGGIFLGLIVLGCSYVLLRLLAGEPLRVRFPSSLLLALVPLFFFLLFPSHSGAQSMGVLTGVILGYLLEQRYIRFAVRRPLWQQSLKVLIGLAGAFVLLFGLKALFEPLLPSVGDLRADGGVPPVPGRGFLAGRGYESLTFIRYALVALWATLVAPALFGWLFGREEASDAPV